MATGVNSGMLTRFLDAAKFNRNLRFYGTESFLPFVKISYLNLCLNGLYGEVAYSTGFLYDCL